MATPSNDLPEEDKFLLELGKQRLNRKQDCQHEYVDLPAGCKRGDPTICIQPFYCKHCLKIRIIQFDQSMMNLQWDDDENKDYRDD